MLRPIRLAIGIAVGALTISLAAQTQSPSWPREAEQPDAPKPAAPSPGVAVLLGEYETRAVQGAPARQLIMFEQSGEPWMTIDRGAARRFRLPGTEAFQEEAPRGVPKRTLYVLVDGVRFDRVQVGPEGGGQLKVTPVRPVADVLKEAMATDPPKETGDFLKSDLVEVAKLDATVKLDVRYATTNNFLGSVFYAEARTFLQRPAAEAVLRVQEQLKSLGYGLLLHDGYRPWYVTKAFWDATPLEKHWLVANPTSGSKHNRGCAIDLTLYDLKTGAVIEMPSTYDESTQRAYAFYPGGTALQRWHRALLRRLMEAEGFTVNPEEWWHFDYKDWKRYAIGNVAFDKIR